MHVNEEGNIVFQTKDGRYSLEIEPERWERWKQKGRRWLGWTLAYVIGAMSGAAF